MRLPKLQTCFTLAVMLLVCLIIRLLWISQCGGQWTVFGGWSGSAQGGNQKSYWRTLTGGGGDGGETVMVKRDELVVKDTKTGNVYNYHNGMPLIFIGGFPRSGTTLMRAMLDAHPEVRCGEETRVVPRILGMRAQWKRNEKEWRRLVEAGVTDAVLDSAISSFILEIVAKHAQPAPRLCNKDPFALKSTEYLSQLFPKAKFVLMIRDGRATVHSMISRGVTVTGFDLKNPRQCLEKWNQAISQMYHQCYLVGDNRCFPMYYEQLVLHPDKHMRDLLQFLNLPWNDSVLHHEMFIGKEISLSKAEKSTDQVVKPVNTDSLTAWVGKFPQEVVRDMSKIAPMLAHLGYDPDANPPDYGRADDFVLRKTEDLHKNRHFWERKVAEVFNSTGKGKIPPAAASSNDSSSNEAPSSSYYAAPNAGVGVVANRTLPKVRTKPRENQNEKIGDGAAAKPPAAAAAESKNESAATAGKDNRKANGQQQDLPPVDLEAMKFTIPPDGAPMKLEDDTV